MGLAMIVATLAFFIALLALWLSSDIIKKVESQNDKFVRAHIKTIRDEMRELETSIVKLKRRIDVAREESSGHDKRLNDHTKNIDGLRQRFAELNEEFNMLDRSIPTRYRQRVAKPETTEQAKTKPTVQ